MCLRSAALFLFDPSRFKLYVRARVLTSLSNPVHASFTPTTV
jgi:hypothetical protein